MCYISDLNMVKIENKVVGGVVLAKPKFYGIYVDSII